LRELIVWLKANPNKASAGITTIGFRLVAAFFQKETGTQFTLIPYRGAPPAMQDLALGALVKTSAEKWWPIIKAAGIKAE
jgi:tripartite-type tricarboxylate transporter receptor subunit TctC